MSMLCRFRGTQEGGASCPQLAEFLPFIWLFRVPTGVENLSSGHWPETTISTPLGPNSIGLSLSIFLMILFYYAQLPVFSKLRHVPLLRYLCVCSDLWPPFPLSWLKDPAKAQPTRRNNDCHCISWISTMAVALQKLSIFCSDQYQHMELTYLWTSFRLFF